MAQDDGHVGDEAAGGGDGFDDVLATPGLLADDDATSKGPGGGRHPSDRLGGVRLGRPLGYALPAPTPRPHRDLLLCFPFDLEEPPYGRAYEQVTLTVELDDGAHALALHPAPGTTAGDGAEVAAFGLGRDRLRWTFRARGRGGALRPDGRWAQAVVRLPAGAGEVSGRLGLEAVTVQSLLGGTFRRRRAATPHDIPFRLRADETWSAAAPPARDAALPGAWALTGSGAAAEPDPPDGHEEPELPPGVRRLCLAVDIEKYSARDNANMVLLQRVLLRTLRAACARAGIGWERCGRQAQGDGYLLVLEPGIDESRVVPALLDGLAAGLAAGNALAPVRMRASLHQGIVHEAPGGYAGSAVVALFRVLDSAPVRRTLADTPEVHLVAAFSDPLYQDLVASSGYAGLSADGFRRAEVRIEAKDFSSVAWIRAVAVPPFTAGTPGGTR
ncbi:hypothetical protein [Streptomyces caniscabiei]|uniref:Guanylate cyclase domain-containing protein n=1 Tax=Streptomyces caniscabiei TaxID=2746961 RepID=A0ABU4MMP6_9ACTN|nr:hypothetical protein [Streptomyces caniscabiei]MBE4734412.1 hypothetical protein [Streptomyces caniscabiei]MBE4755283.1 hypothetical protein [Streptomyces caniscabiei]MBE4771363.1 hypothetical protein [Streptomyces caniscabiei]MBE4783432.1 hypothetical protein [Streptomyces caniscabiei]MBE4792736.1 hypothetical protein [Streptomyces caniscabiei]